ncbi:MAG: patatin-like phospholipase family protein [Bacteroidetes bacterium]|nr:patatin-like phospholipase family protein [Bacteroidota bacterium]
MNLNYSLCLSGGGARGMAHIGIAKALNNYGVKINAISGTSAGAFLAAFLANNTSPFELEEIILSQLSKPKLQFKKIKHGIFDTDFIETILTKNLKNTLIENSLIQLFINATNYDTAAGLTFNKGNIIDAVVASCSIPIVFKPRVINSEPMVDGGLSCNLNVNPLLNLGYPIIAANVNPISKYESNNSAIKQLDRVIHLALRTHIVPSIQSSAIFIEPPELKNYSLFDYSKIKEIIKVGFEYTSHFLNTNTLIS